MAKESAEDKLMFRDPLPGVCVLLCVLISEVVVFACVLAWNLYLNRETCLQVSSGMF